jgi:hypothetical protein
MNPTSPIIALTKDESSTSATLVLRRGEEAGEKGEDTWSEPRAETQV